MKSFGFFKKKGNRVLHIATVEAKALEDIDVKDLFYYKGQFVPDSYSMIKDYIESYKNGSKVYECPRDVGTVFMIEGSEKIAKFLFDNGWIEAVRELAKVYPDRRMHFIEAHRSHRSNKEASLRKCLSKIKEVYPDFEFMPLAYFK